MKSQLTFFESLKLLALALVAILLVPARAFGRVILQSPMFWRVCVRGISPTSDLGKLAKAWGLVDQAGGIISQAVQAKTANYAIVLATDPSDSVFTTRGNAGAITFTLPAVTLAMKGIRYRFINVVGQNMIIAAAAGAVVTFNNAAATSVAAQTANQLIGAEIVAECDGTSWLVRGVTVGVTYTVA